MGALARRLEGAEWLDRPADTVRVRLSPVLGAGTLAGVLRGRWLGHPAHPMQRVGLVHASSNALVGGLLGGHLAFGSDD